MVRFGNQWEQAHKDAFKQTSPFPTGSITTETAADAYKSVLAKAGASLVRDAVDTRVINEVMNGTGAIINSENDRGGWPAYNTYNVQKDSDGDGMPDEWEKKHGLNPNDPKDRNGDKNKNGYTNLEDYINSLVGNL